MDGKTISLGWSFAKYNDAKHCGPKLTIVTPSFDHETHFHPAECVTIWNVSALVALRDFLIEVLEVKP